MFCLQQKAVEELKEKEPEVTSVLESGKEIESKATPAGIEAIKKEMGDLQTKWTELQEKLNATHKVGASISVTKSILV